MADKKSKKKQPSYAIGARDPRKLPLGTGALDKIRIKLNNHDRDTMERAEEAETSRKRPRRYN